MATKLDDAARQCSAHDLQRFVGERDHLGSAAPCAAHRGDPAGARATSDAEDDPAAGQHAQRRSGFGEDGRWPQLQVRDVGEERDALGLGSQEGDQRPDVEELGVVGVVLDGEVVEARGIGCLSELPCLSELTDLGIQAQPKGDRMPVVRHEARQSTYGPL